MAYQLERYLSTRSAIYRQLYRYYHYCENVRHMRPATIKSKVYVINSFVQDTKISNLKNLTNQHIYAWIAHQQNRGNAGRSINDRLAHILAMLRWQRDMDLRIPKLKLGLITKVNEEPPRKVFFSRQEIEHVLRQANILEELLIRLAFDCGLRISELQNLRLSDLNGDRLSIIGKGNKRRYAYLCQETRRQLEKWISAQGISNYLWRSPMKLDSPMAICTIRKIMQGAFARAGYTDFCPHDLRHSYATDLKKSGVSTRKIQAGLGHASEATTERYLSDLDGFDLREIYQIKYSHDVIPVENSEKNLTKSLLT